MKNLTTNIISISIAALSLFGCSNGSSSSNPKQSLNHTISDNAISINNINYSYTSSFQGSTGATISINNSSLVTSPESITITTNFSPTIDGACFTSTWGSNTTNIIQVGNQYQTTISAPTGQSLNLATTCGLAGGATVLTGVQDAIVNKMTINNTIIPINQQCLTSNCSDPGNKKIIAGYYTNWAMYAKKYNVTDIQFNSLNHVIYAFIGFDPSTGNIKSLDTWADSNQMPSLSKAVVEYPYLHASLSFGGWTNASQYTAPMFDQLTQSDTAIATFTQQAVAAMRAAGYDGIDIDWEWWSNYTTAPAAQQIKLFTALRNALNSASQSDGRKYYLTIAVSAGIDKIQATETASAGAWQTIAGLVDNLNVMAYDMHGAFDSTSDFQAPWNMQTNDPYESTGYAINLALNQYISFGVPANKIVVGIPAYGRAMEISTLNNYGLYQPVTGTPTGDYDDGSSGATGVFLYKCIINPTTCNANSSTISALTFITQGNSIYTTLSSQAQQPWGYGATPQGNIFITYDDVASTTYKATQVMNNNMAGAMIWELDGDTIDESSSLLSAIRGTFNK